MKVQLGGPQSGLCRCHVGIGLGKTRNGGFKLLGARDIALTQLFLSVRLLTGLKLGGLGPLQCRLCAFHLHPERFRVDAVENVAFLHHAALFEDTLDKDAGDAWAHFGDARRGDAAGQLVGDGQRLRLDLDIAHARWRHGGCPALRLARALVVATGEEHGNRRDGDQVLSHSLYLFNGPEAAPWTAPGRSSLRASVTGKITVVC